MIILEVMLHIILQPKCFQCGMCWLEPNHLLIYSLVTLIKAVGIELVTCTPRAHIRGNQITAGGGLEQANQTKELSQFSITHIPS
jgi:hypothetical protein